MVYRIAGVLVAGLGLLSLLAPSLALKWEQHRTGHRREFEVTEDQLLMVRVAGLAFVGIGLAFLGVHYGVLG